MMPSQNAFTPVVLSSPSTPRLRVHVVPFGLTIHRILLEGGTGENAQTHDLIVSPEDPEDHERHGRCFFGPIVGRFANRLPSGRSELGKQDGHIDLPEWGGDGVCHHGGPEGRGAADEDSAQSGPFDRLIWRVLSAKEVTLFEAKDAGTAEDHSQAVFAIKSPSGDNGFPGELLVEAKISLAQPTQPISQLGQSAGSVRAEYRATILNNSAQATPLNLTHHWGFNLSASSPFTKAREEKGTIDAHQLRIVPTGSGLKRLELDDRGVPTGGLLDCPTEDVEGHGWTAEGHDGHGKAVADHLPAGGYDHFYTWGRKDESTTRALLHSAATGLTLSFKTNQTGVQFYSANGQPHAPANPQVSGGVKKSLHRTDASDNHGNATRSAAFLEFGHPHATFLHKSLQDHVGEDTILKNGETYRNWVEVEVYHQQ